MKIFKTLALLIITCATGYAQCGTRSSYEMDSTWELFSYDLGRLDSIYLSKKSIIDSLNGPGSVLRVLRQAFESLQVQGLR